MSRIKWSLIAVFIAAVVYWWMHGASEASSLEALLKDVRGKRVLVTGASSGIGEELAYAYSRLGAKLMLTARRGDLLKAVATRCRDLGAERVEYVAADMAIPLHRHMVVNETGKLFDNGLDHLILNHALMPMGRWSGNMADFRRVLEVNFLSFVELASMCLDMLRASRGNLAVVSSVAGKFPHPYAAMYVTSKFALQGFFGSLRQELKWAGDNVSVTLLVLGLINTEMASENAAKHFPSTGPAQVAATAVDVQSTADAVIRGVVSRTYEVRYPLIASIFLQVHKFASEFLEDFHGQRVHAGYGK